MMHIYQKGTPVYLLLHGTGGDEHNLVHLLKAIDPDAGYLGVRGNVVERGMNRFFKGIGQSTWDPNEIQLRVTELVDFIKKSQQQYNIGKLRLLGFSNGANMGAQLIVEHPELFEAALLFKPLLPAPAQNKTRLDQLHVFISAGHRDKWIPKKSTEQLIKHLKTHGAQLITKWWDRDHSIHQEEIEAAKNWIANL